MKEIFLLVFLMGVGCSSPSDPVSRGRARFVGMGCSTCHRVGSSGGQAGPDLTLVGVRHSNDWLHRWMGSPKEWKPNTTMPAYQMTPEVQAEIVAYLATLRGEPYRQRPPWDSPALKAQPVVRGEIIYNRVGCGVCHGVSGRGGARNNNVPGGQIPGLARVREGFTREELAERIARGRVPDAEDPSQPAPLIAMPAWGTYLSPDEIHDVVEYLYSLLPVEKSSEDWSQ